ncbi:MAG: DedA family protein [Acidimicrobiales bacterium]
MVTELLHGLLSLSGWPAYTIVGLLCFGEAAFFVGFVLPGEIAVVYGGVLASEHHVSLVWMLVLVVGAAILGDSTGYEVGRHLGPYLLRRWPLRGSKHVSRTTDFVRRRGGRAVFIGRFVSVFRALTPGIAGVSGLRYPIFLLYNALGGVIWGIGFTLAGFYAGTSYRHFLNVTGRATTVAVIVVVAAFVAFVVIRRLRERRQEMTEPEPEPGADRPGGLDGPPQKPPAGDSERTGATGRIPD